MRAKSVCTPMIALACALSLCGCVGEQADNDLALALRSDFLSMEGCTGAMTVTADYGQRVYTYDVEFTSSQKDGMTLTITAPEEVAGISAHIAAGETWLEFDGVQIETGPLNSDGLTPLDALPAILTAVRSGYIAETNSEQAGERDTLRLCCRDPEREPGEGLETVLWFDKEQKTLLRGELRQDGASILQCEFSSFAIILPQGGGSEDSP